MIDNTMKISLLPTPLIIHHFVKNEPNCNYELYLLELLNNSTWFKKRYPEGFVRPISESKGECDAINPNYQLDFKLLLSSSYCKAKNELTDQITKIETIGIAWSDPKKKDSSQIVTNLHAAIRNMTLQQFKEIRNANLQNYSIEKDIQNMLKIFETKKNLFLFFPYVFTFESKHNIEESIECIKEGLENDFNIAFEYRKEYVPNYETFFSCIYENLFIIFKIENNDFILCDTVKTSDVTIFYNLMNNYIMY